MQDQVAVVTGAGAGIGRAIAKRLACEGMALVVADIDRDGGAETVLWIEAEGGRAAFVQTDVTSEADVQAMITFAEQHFGGLDVLVNNAGGAPEPHFPEAEPEHWGRTLELNLRGVMLGIQFGIQAMRKRGGGAIVNISSMAGIGFQAYDAPEYAAGKAGVVRLSAALGYLRDQCGIRVNCICPGWVETQAVHVALARMTTEEKEEMTFAPPPVLIQPEEIAEAVMMFIRDDALAGRVMIWPDGEAWQLIPVGVPY